MTAVQLVNKTQALQHPISILTLTQTSKFGTTNNNRAKRTTRHLRSTIIQHRHCRTVTRAFFFFQTARGRVLRQRADQLFASSLLYYLLGLVI